MKRHLREIGRNAQQIESGSLKMVMREPRYTPDEHARRGTEMYEKIVRPKVEAGNTGKIVSIDVETGEYELGETTLEAAERLLKRLPDAEIWSERIGYPAVYRFGGRHSEGR